MAFYSRRPYPGAVFMQQTNREKEQSVNMIRQTNRSANLCGTDTLLRLNTSRARPDKAASTGWLTVWPEQTIGFTRASALIVNQRHRDKCRQGDTVYGQLLFKRQRSGRLWMRSRISVREFYSCIPIASWRGLGTTAATTACRSRWYANIQILSAKQTIPVSLKHGKT